MRHASILSAICFACLPALCQDGDLPARVQKVVHLLESRPAAPDAWPELMQTLAGDPELDSIIAARALYAVPRPATDAPMLAAFLQHETKARAAAAWELSRIGPAAGEATVRALLEALQYPDKHERNFVVLALAMDGPRDRDLAAAFTRVLNDPGSPDSPQRNYKFPQATAAVALRMLRSEVPKSDESLQSLTRIVAERPRQTNAKLVDGLRALGAYAGAVRPIRKKGSAKAAPAVHESIALALGYLDSLTPPPDLQQIVREEKEGVMSAATVRYIMALGGVQQGIGAALLESVKAGERDPRVLAIRRLGELGPPARDAIPVLREAARDPDWIARREAVLALRRIEK